MKKPTQTNPPVAPTEKKKGPAHEEAIKHRYDFMFLFDVENGNPNGDPDSDGMPRTDRQTSVGLVTNVCLKHKIRKYVEMAAAGKTRKDSKSCDIYVRPGDTLNAREEEAYAAFGTDLKHVGELKKDDPEIDVKLRDWLCDKYFDIRTFGQVLTGFAKAKLNGGQICGPVQLNHAPSVEPVETETLTLTRCAITRDEDADKKVTEMANQHIVRYGLYRCEGYVSADLAQKTTGFCEEDLELLWEAIMNMFEHDHAAGRGKIALRELFIFKHDSVHGNAPSWKLFDAVKVERAEENKDAPARKFSDYVVTVDESAIPESVTLIRRKP